MAYTPEHNGAVKGLNQTLLERVRAMLLDAGLPDALWAEAVLAANYVRVLSPALAEPKTPTTLLGERT